MKAFSRFSAYAAFALLNLFAVASHAQTAAATGATQDKDPAYNVVSPAQPSDTPGKMEVLEFFAYICPHCAAMAPMVAQWRQTAPADVVVKLVPISWNAKMVPMQRMYYTLAALDRLDLHEKVFSAIHVDGKKLFDRDQLADWAATQGIDKSKFLAVFDSFSVTNDVQRASQLAEAYHVDATPTFAVGGKFTTSPGMAGNSYEGALKEVDKLIPMARGQ